MNARIVGVVNGRRSRRRFGMFFQNTHNVEVIMPLHKMVDDGKSRITQTFDNGNSVTYDLTDLPEVSDRYIRIRGGRKVLSDELAGFEGNADAAEKRCMDKWKQLQKGIVRSPSTAFPTIDQLAGAFHRIAPELGETECQERASQIHPDATKDNAEKTQRRKYLKGYMEFERLQKELAKVGFIVPKKPKRDLEDLLS